MVGIQLHDPIHKSQSQSSQPIGGTPFENTTNLNSLIHSLNSPSCHACLLAGGMVCASHLCSVQPISEPEQKDGMTSDPESLSAETGRQPLLACIRKFHIVAPSIAFIHRYPVHSIPPFSHFLVCTHGKALFSTYQPAWDRIHNFFSRNPKTVRQTRTGGGRKSLIIEP